ncbi:MAG TPA: beta-ketoacyl-ACP synthase II [Gemmatimonadaceae bacterium]|jgi:3-oxoacyl-[acyl-carrier-protein] synthase II|nr:beta-ketoacyl-ACP synthase II [Gemmatimonadaceae bacterium]
MRRRVVVTGLGAITPLGNDVATTWRAMQAGVSGAANITKFDASTFPVRFACEVKGFDPLKTMERKEAKRADLYAQYAVAASVEAMADAALTPGAYEVDRTGVIIGSGIGGLKSFEEQHDVYRERGQSKISPFFIPMFIADIAAGVVSMRFNARGPNYATVSACSTSAHAIGDAFRTIQYGDADIIISGGAEATVTPMAIGGFANMTALSERNDSPATASRPFDLTRDGFVMGEGAGIVILEELEHARARGARIYGEVVGYRASADAYHLTGQLPEHEGLQRAMRGALADAGMRPDEVDYVNAHGTSTPLNDSNEAMAIAKVFGEAAQRVSISSTKSMTGHMLGAAGAVEFIASTLAIRDGVAPPTINYCTPDPACGDLDFTPNQARAREVRAALSNSAGFGGHNVSLVVKRYQE